MDDEEECRLPQLAHQAKRASRCLNPVRPIKSRASPLCMKAAEFMCPLRKSWLAVVRRVCGSVSTENTLLKQCLRDISKHWGPFELKKCCMYIGHLALLFSRARCLYCQLHKSQIQDWIVKRGVRGKVSKASSSSLCTVTSHLPRQFFHSFFSITPFVCEMKVVFFEHQTKQSMKQRVRHAQEANTTASCSLIRRFGKIKTSAVRRKLINQI